MAQPTTTTTVYRGDGNTLTVPTGMPVYDSVEAWLAAATERFGDAKREWAFTCPRCSRTATVAEFEAAGVDGRRAPQECLGRHVDTIDCDWAARGLLGTMGAGVVIRGAGRDGADAEVFAFADPAPPSSPSPTCWCNVGQPSDGPDPRCPVHAPSPTGGEAPGRYVADRTENGDAIVLDTSKDPSPPIAVCPRGDDDARAVAHALNGRLSVGALVVIDPESEAFEEGGDAPFGGWVTHVRPDEVNVKFLGRCEADPGEQQDGRGWVWGWTEWSFPLADVKPLDAEEFSAIQQTVVNELRASAPTGGREAWERRVTALMLATCGEPGQFNWPDGLYVDELEARRLVVTGRDQTGEGYCELTEAGRLFVDAVMEDVAREVLSETDTPTDAAPDGGQTAGARVAELETAIQRARSAIAYERNGNAEDLLAAAMGDIAASTSTAIVRGQAAEVLAAADALSRQLLEDGRRTSIGAELRNALKREVNYLAELAPAAPDETGDGARPENDDCGICQALLSGALEVTAYQQYGNGTVQLTLKPPAPAPVETREGGERDAR